MKNGILDFEFTKNGDFTNGVYLLKEVVLNVDVLNKLDSIEKSIAKIVNDALHSCNAKLCIPVINIENSTGKQNKNISYIFNVLSACGWINVIIVGLSKSAFDNVRKSWPTFCKKYTEMNVLFYVSYVDGNTQLEYYLPELLTTHFPKIASDITHDKLDIRFKRPHTQSLLFIKDSKLLEFDILIKKGEHTLFELYTKACIERNLLNNDGKAHGNKTNFPGYKFEKIHVKIGQKSHVKNFYYYSKLFQDVFFASRFALQIANYSIKNNLYVTRESSRFPSRTGSAGFQIESNIFFKTNMLVGYAKYSELLLIRLAFVLNKFYENKAIKFEYNIIPQNIPMHFSKVSKISKSIGDKSYTVITCTGLTLDTTLRIYDFLKQYGDDNIKKPFFNLVISTEGLKQGTEPKTEEQIIKYLDWTYINREEKIVRIKDNSISVDNYDNTQENSIRNVKYFIDTSSTWSKSENCPWCFPTDRPEDEIPVFEPNKINVTPILFSNKFQYTGKDLIIHTSRKFSINSDDYFYGHQHYISQTNIHHVHTVDIQNLLNRSENDQMISTWINEIKSRIKRPPKDGRIILMVLDENIYSSFAGRLNRELFDDQAIIIYYDRRNDLTANFSDIYSDIIEDAGCIYFLDDVIVTGSSLFASSNVIKQFGRKFNGIFSLLVRADDQTITIIKKELEKGGNFFTLHYYRVPPLSQYNLPCPMCDKENLYNSIADSCSLNTLRTIFLGKRKDLRIDHSIDKGKTKLLDYFDEVSIAEKFSDYNYLKKTIEKLERRIEYKHLLKFYITDIIFSLVADKNNTFFEYNESIDPIVEHVQNTLKSDPGIASILDRQICKEYIIKILSLPPFTYYSSIKNCIFKWMIVEANDAFERINSDKEIDLFQELKYIKLILKRLAELKSTYLLRSDTLEKILTLYERKAIAKLRAVEDSQNNAINKLTSIYGLRELNDDLTNLPDIAGREFSENYLPIISKKLRSRGVIMGASDNEWKKGGILATDQFYKNQIRFYCQFIQNCDNKIDTIDNYQYSLASYVKEIIHSDDEKSVILERGINDLYKDHSDRISKSTDFNRLLLLFKLENIDLINKAIKIRGRYKKIWDADIVINENKQIVELFNLENERLSNVVQKDQEKTVVKTPQRTLGENLQKVPEEQIYKPHDLFNFFSELHQKTFTGGDEDFIGKVHGILNNVASILGVNHDKTEMSLSIKYKPYPINIEKRDDIYVFFPKKQGGYLLRNSFIPNMMDGVSAQPNGGPTQTIVEYALINGKYETIVPDVWDEKKKVKIKTDNKVEFSKKEYSNILFFRIADIKYEQDNLINMGQAVIFIGVVGKEGKFYQHERLRYLMLTKQKLLGFIQTNTDNDSFRAYIEDKEKNFSWNLSKHGMPRYFEGMQELIDDSALSTDKKKKLSIFLLLVNQANFIMEMKNKNLKGDGLPLHNKLKDIKIKKNDIIDNINEIGKVIFESLKIVGPKDWAECTSDLKSEKDFHFEMNEGLLKIILAELFINIKKNTETFSFDEIGLNIKIVPTNEPTERPKYFLQIYNRFDEIGLLRSQIKGEIANNKRTTSEYKPVHGVPMIRDIFVSIYNNQDFRELQNVEEYTYFTNLPLLNFEYE